MLRLGAVGAAADGAGPGRRSAQLQSVPRSLRGHTMVTATVTRLMATTTNPDPAWGSFLWRSPSIIVAAQALMLASRSGPRSSAACTMRTFMTVVCPICKSSAQEVPRTGDATGFHCPTHGDFKVADAVFAEAKAKDYTRDQWEAALDKAEQRAEPDEDELPLIIVDDFY